VGYGGYIVEHGMHTAQGNWLPEEAQQSSTWRELVAVYRVLEAIANKLRNCRVRWFTDNQNVARLLLVGSRKEHLQIEVLKVFSLCVSHSIHLEPEWIPRKENELADYISRIVDSDDWQLEPTLFAWLDNVWGPHTVDRFASQHNAQLPRFNSRFACKDTEAVDAFTMDWSGENNWWCPPPMLITRVLRHAEACRAQGTLLVPAWESAPFWPMLCSDGLHWSDFVIDVISLPLTSCMFHPGRSGSVLFKGAFPNTGVLAIRLEF